MSTVRIHWLEGSFIASAERDIADFDWPGWRRCGVGVYKAKPYPSSILSMRPPASMTLHWDAQAAAQRDAIMQDLALALKALEAKDPLPGATWPTEKKPRLHQLQAIKAIELMHNRVLLNDEMGLGKTSTALWAAERAKATRVLVICPVSVKYNWQDEVAQTLGDSWFCVVIDGPPRKRAQQFAEAIADHKGAPGVIVVNYDLLRHLTPDQRLLLRRWVGCGMLILDEAHYIKEAKAERSKYSLELCEHSPGTLALTGTPIRNHAIDLYAQVQAVRPGTWTSLRAFSHEHVVMRSLKTSGGREVYKPVGTKNLEGLNRILNTMRIRRFKSDVTSLPPKVYSFPKLKLEDDLKVLYDAMADFAKVELQKLVDAPGPATSILGDINVRHGSQVFTPKQLDEVMNHGRQLNIWDPRAKSAVEQAMRCEQIAQGFVGGIPDPVMAKIGAKGLKHAVRIAGRPNELIFPHAPKLVWLLETIESIVLQGGFPLVLSRFNAPMFWLQEELSRRSIVSEVLHGGLNAEGKAGVVASFSNQVSKVLIAQVKMAEGWNAVHCQDVLFLGRDWSPAINAQGEDRAHRMGQKGTVNVQVPIVDNTIERMIHRRLESKASQADQALKAMTINELMEGL